MSISFSLPPLSPSSHPTHKAKPWISLIVPLPPYYHPRYYFLCYMSSLLSLLLLTSAMVSIPSLLTLQRTKSTFPWPFLHPTLQENYTQRPLPSNRTPSTTLLGSNVILSTSCNFWMNSRLMLWIGMNHGNVTWPSWTHTLWCPGRHQVERTLPLSLCAK